MLLCPSVQRHEPVFPAQGLHHPSCCVPLRFLSALLLLEIWAQAKGVSYFKAVSWDFFFPSSKFVICFLPEHFPLPPLPWLWLWCQQDLQQALLSLHVPGRCCSGHTLPWCWLLSCLLKLSLIFSVQLLMKCGDGNQSVSACHLATSTCEERVLKCQRSALLHQHLLVG